MTTSGNEPAVAPELLEKLACPACAERPPVRLVAGPAVACTRCGRRYPIQDGIVVMLPDEAELPSEAAAATNGDDA